MSRLLLATIAAVACCSTDVVADSHAKGSRHRHPAVVKSVRPAEPAFSGRLVAHPAWNIACMTRDRATRALPCDQPVWVYGSPCEVDLGLGRYRSCD
jgi:hypothetical protein